MGSFPQDTHHGMAEWKKKNQIFYWNTVAALENKKGKDILSPKIMPKFTLQKSGTSTRNWGILLVFLKGKLIL